MAFNLLIDLSDRKVNWKNVNQKLQVVINDYFEFFPIFDLPGDKKSYLGLSVLKKEIPKHQIETLKKVLKDLTTEEGYKIFELYSSNELTDSNIDILIGKYIG